MSFTDELKNLASINEEAKRAQLQERLEDTISIFKDDCYYYAKEGKRSHDAFAKKRRVYYCFNTIEEISFDNYESANLYRTLIKEKIDNLGFLNASVEVEKNQKLDDESIKYFIRIRVAW